MCGSQVDVLALPAGCGSVSQWTVADVTGSGGYRLAVACYGTIPIAMTPIPRVLPGAIGRGYRDGGQTAPGHANGRITFEDDIHGE